MNGKIYMNKTFTSRVQIHLPKTWKPPMAPSSTFLKGVYHITSSRKLFNAKPWLNHSFQGQNNGVYLLTNTLTI